MRKVSSKLTKIMANSQYQLILALRGMALVREAFDFWSRR
jgi:hypothetical protein